MRKYITLWPNLIDYSCCSWIVFRSHPWQILKWILVCTLNCLQYILKPIYTCMILNVNLWMYYSFEWILSLSLCYLFVANKIHCKHMWISVIYIHVYKHSLFLSLWSSMHFQYWISAYGMIVIGPTRIMNDEKWQASQTMFEDHL